MLSAIRNNRSLTFYQPISSQFKERDNSYLAESVIVNPVLKTNYQTFSTTSGYNNQLNNFFQNLHEARADLDATLAAKLADNPSYKGLRNQGVKLAWSYEQADIEMGGRGSEQWTDQEMVDIRDRGSVRGAEGHHQKNVADHPADQVNPDNIKFYRTREEHLQKGHGGNWNNQTDAKMTNKDQMLKDTNNRRVFRNELQGIGIAAAIGCTTGFTIGFISTLATRGISPDSIRNAFVSGAKISIETGFLSLASYGINRTLGMVASTALMNGLANAGIQITENLKHVCALGATGLLTIGIFSVYQFEKLIIAGCSTKAALIQTGKQAAFSLSILTVALAIQQLCGGNSGIIVSVGIGIIYIAYSLIDSVHQRDFTNRIQVYMIEKSKPLLA